MIPGLIMVYHIDLKKSKILLGSGLLGICGASGRGFTGAGAAKRVVWRAPRVGDGNGSLGATKAPRAPRARKASNGARRGMGDMDDMTQKQQKSESLWSLLSFGLIFDVGKCWDGWFLSCKHGGFVARVLAGKVYAGWHLNAPWNVEPSKTRLRRS